MNRGEEMCPTNRGSGGGGGGDRRWWCTSPVTDGRDALRKIGAGENGFKRLDEDFGKY